MKHELDEMMNLIKDYKTGYGGVTDSFMRKELEMFAKNYHGEQCNIADVMRSSPNDKLVEIAVPKNSLILTVNATKHHNKELFKEWMKEFFEDDVNFA